MYACDFFRIKKIRYKLHCSSRFAKKKTEVTQTQHLARILDYMITTLNCKVVGK